MLRRLLVGCAIPPPFGFVFGDLILVGLIICIGLLHGVLGFAEGILDFAFDLLGSALYLSLFVAGPLSDLAFDSARDVLGFAFHSVLIHDDSSGMHD
jgi:hypothetical protein